jgi:murein DD-endopeptidase MepM/ murein hydrolase activator NlpD
MSAVTIGGQTFIKTEAGWVDKKTKIPAPEGLTTLLDNVAEEESPAGKKARARIDTTRPVVKLGKSEYVWDLNGKVWIDRKTKDPVNPKFSKLIEATYQSIEAGVTPEEKLYKKWADTAAKGQVFSGMGVTGTAAQQKVKKPTGGGQFTVPNIKINSPIVKMIEKLAVIDSYLKQRLTNQTVIASRQVAATREQQIEAPAQDATPVVDNKQLEQAVQEENKKSNAAMVGVAAVAATVIASQFEPVKEAFSGVIDFTKTVYNYMSKFVGFMNETLESMNGSSGTSEQQSNNGNVTAPPSSPVAPNQATTGMSKPTESSSSKSTPSTAATAVSSSTSSTARNTSATAVASRTSVGSSGSTSSTSSRSSASGSKGTGGNGSSSRSPSSSRSSSPTGSSDATRTAAPSPTTTTPPPPVNSELGSAQNGTIWAGTDASGMKTFVRKINGKFETWTSADSTHYQIDENQATAQISSRGLKNVNTSDATKAAAGADSVDGYINPVEGYSINSGYGMRDHPVQGGRKFHTGVDIAAPGGTPVRAVKSGTVTKISNNQRPYSGFGNVVIIDHGDGYQTVYAHLSKFACRQGDQVKQGQIIGYVGSTGMSTGNHLHFIVQKTGFAAPNAGNTVNPATLLRKGGVTIPAGMEGYDMESGGAGSSTLQQAASAGWAMTEGAMEAVGNILRTAIDSGNMKTVELGTQMSDMTTASSINSAAKEKNAAMAKSRSTEESASAPMDPLNLNAKAGSSTVQNLPTKSDLAGVEFYLTRMGFPKIEYAKPQQSTRWA